MMPGRPDTGGSRTKLEARDAIVGKESITDLIDFVRAGPKNPEGHRIPRSVAPFRTTMDSDQLNAATGGKAIDASFADSRYSQLSTNPSLQSMTSQTALLKNKKPVNKPAPQRDDFDEQDMMPKRKTRRVKDPYAIDLSDDEEELEAPKEESLADFLRNAEPLGNEAEPKPFVLDSSGSTTTKPRKKSSFFGRNSMMPPAPPPKPAGTSPTSPMGREPSGRAGSGNTSGDDLSRQPMPPRVLQKQQQHARGDVRTTATGTSDLADFLRNSEPPAGAAQPRPLGVNEDREKEKENGGFASRVFGRKKKVSTTGF